MSEVRVLCVDDDDQTRTLIARLVTAAGHDCVATGTVDGARRLLAEQSFVEPGRLRLRDEAVHGERPDDEPLDRPPPPPARGRAPLGGRLGASARVHAPVAGADISLEGRIVAVADVFDALSSDRPYRPALSTEEALDVLRADSGRAFDPQIVEVFVRALQEVLV